MPTAISQERFEALVMFVRRPEQMLISRELEWFADDKERVLGVVLLDTIDDDYAYVVLGRDEKKRFRCITNNCSYPTVGRARTALIEAMNASSAKSDEAFHQGDHTMPGVELFAPVAAPEKLHPAFRYLVEREGYSPARELLSELMHHWIDVDGNFVEQFQTTGFDARIWELYVYALLIEERLLVTRPVPAPDFRAERFNEGFFIEAMTVGSGATIPKDLTTLPKPPSPEEFGAFIHEEMPIRFGSPLFSKLKRRYWELPSIGNDPVVFAIADFHEPGSMTWTSTALTEYLYGVRHDFSHAPDGTLIISPLKVKKHTRADGKTIPSGFFFQPDAEHISAVLFSASGTLSKFNRMARLAGFGSPRITMRRIGVCHDHDPNAVLPKKFDFVVEPGKVKETWGEGVSVFHNPNALQPLSEAFLPNVAHHRFDDGQIVSALPEFFPYSAVTLNKVTRNS